MSETQPIQKTLFEEDFLVRILGNIAHVPDVALMELVANAWDAGASKVSITIPEERGEELTVHDNGAGLTPEQFHKRWMTLGYNRVKHQGPMADLPSNRKDWKRRAYGRNGMGRHGLLCFADKYTVETVRDGTRGTFVVAVASGEAPFALLSEETAKGRGHGTTLSAATELLPDPDRIREVLSRRFLHDPQFTVEVNGKSVSLADHTGLLDQFSVSIADGVQVEMFTIQGTESGRMKMPSGIAFWVGSRLVGEPGWRVGEKSLLDGRSAISKRLAIVVKSDDLFDFVEADWSAFKEHATIYALYDAVAKYVGRISQTVFADRIKENKTTALRDNKEALAELKPHARLEVAEFLDQVAGEMPTTTPEIISVAVKAVINLEKTRSGQDLLRKLSLLSADDVEGINRLLENWTVRDALAVLDEIDRRLSVIEALSKVMDDPDADELHTIHPLVTHSRWLFGPEYDSPLFSSNVTIRKAAEKVFKKRIDVNALGNPRQRPDLIFLKDSTLSLVGTEEFELDSTVVKLTHLLLLELKKGRSAIGRDEVRQAEDYVEDLLNCGLLDGPPFIHAFVVGFEIDSRVNPISVGKEPVAARVQPCTFGQLVRTAKVRLFKLHERIAERYQDIPQLELVNRVLGEPTQPELHETDDARHSDLYRDTAGEHCRSLNGADHDRPHDP